MLGRYSSTVFYNSLMLLEYLFFVMFWLSFDSLLSLSILILSVQNLLFSINAIYSLIYLSNFKIHVFG